MPYESNAISSGHSNGSSKADSDGSRGCDDSSDRDSILSNGDDGDLYNWEYLTQTYDHEDTFEERAVSFRLVPTNCDGNTAAASGVTFHAPQCNLADTVVSFVAKAVINLSTNQVYLPQQELLFVPQGSTRSVITVLGSSSVASNEVRFRENQLVKNDILGSTVWATGCMYNTDTDTVNEIDMMDSLPEPSIQTDSEAMSKFSFFDESTILPTGPEPTELTNPAIDMPMDYRSKSLNDSHEQQEKISTPDIGGDIATLEKAAKPQELCSTKRGSVSLARPSQMCLPMSAYNYFCRDESENIVNGLTSAAGPLPDPIQDFTVEREEKLLHRHWYDTLRSVQCTQVAANCKQLLS